MSVFRALNRHPARPCIDVEFVVVHYTVETLDDTLTLLTDPTSDASAHLVISREGDVHEIVPCWDGTCYQAGHAGRSRWRDGDREWANLNGSSIGIELVNRNGNLFPYTDDQYRTLAYCLDHLREIYPALRDAHRVLGHEHIAGWRGKVDPGACFDWKRLYQDVYAGHSLPNRECTCPRALLEAARELVAGEPMNIDDAARYWRAVNAFMERYVALGAGG